MKRARGATRGVVRSIALGVVLGASVAVAQFEGWVVNHFKPTAVQWEWPLLHVDLQGTVVSGMADLIVHTDAGAWIVDHKSDAVEDSAAAFGRYEPQLHVCAEALSATGVTVAGMAVNWVRTGELVMKRSTPT